MASSNPSGLLLAAFTLMVSSVHGFWRMPCESAGLARIDPIVNPNALGEHAHTIHGGGNFSIDTTYGSLRGANCTTCGVTDDHSAYWTPALYFEHSDGTFEVARQVGGMLAYYNLFQLPNLKAFPEGFVMIAGDTNLRNFSWPVPDPPKSSWSGDQISQLALGQKSVGFNCLDYSAPAEATASRHFLPNMSFLNDHCPDGLRLELYFPSCWNGKDVDSPNHKSHVAYPSVIDGGDCPPGYDVRFPTLLFETIWATADFKGQDGRFVLGNGDPTGYGSHGDFINGWDVDFLQNAIDTCTNESGLISDCPAFAGHLQDQNAPISCPIDMPPQLTQENYKGPRQGLPGGVVVQEGPAYAQKEASPAPVSGAVPSSASPTSSPAAAPPTSSPVAAPPPSSPVVASSSTPSSSSAAISSPSPSSSAPAKFYALAEAVSSSQPAITPPPSTPSQSFDTTIISTLSDRVEELFIVKEVVTVSQSSTASPTTNPAARKRHLHKHRHAHAVKHLH